MNIKHQNGFSLVDFIWFHYLNKFQKTEESGLMRAHYFCIHVVLTLNQGAGGGEHPLFIPESPKIILRTLTETQKHEQKANNPEWNGQLSFEVTVVQFQCHNFT